MDGQKYVLRNHCLVEPEQAHDQFIGFQTANFVNPQFEASPFGKVIAAPSIIKFYRRETRRNVSSRAMEASGVRLRRSVQFSSVGIREGDRILFSAMMLVNNEDDMIGPYLMVPVDEIYASFREGETVMQNGYILAEELPYTSEDNPLHGMETSRETDIKPGTASIVNIGEPTEYAYEYTAKDTSVLKVGDIVFYHPETYVTVEWQMYNTLNPSGNRLLRLQRKDIFAISK